MNRFILLFILFINLINSTILAQESSFRVMELNVENLFDCRHDSDKNDYEFLPNGSKHWTAYKYYLKLKNISKTIAIVSEDVPIDVIALTEIENDSTLEALTRHSGLYNLGYSYIMTHSLDTRGIDVALLYQPFSFMPILHYSIRPHFSNNKHSRDILYVKGITLPKDTLNFFICHFPSRTGGFKQSEIYREEAADCLKKNVDSLIRYNSHSNIIILGDFNDEALNSSVRVRLQSIPINKQPSNIREHQLYTLSYNKKGQKGILGTYKYKNQWNQLDQVIVNGLLLKKDNSIYTTYNDCKIIDNDFLLQEDKTNGGEKPYRTYCGPRYVGGFSDHLPMIVKFYFK